MTRLTLKEKSLTIATIMLIVLIILIGLSSCSDRATRQLRKAEKHLKKAEQLGAKVNQDTVWQSVQVPVLQVKTDTVFESKQGDTVVIEKERLQIKYVNLPKDSVFIEGECKADTVIKNVPVKIYKEISSGHTDWEMWILALAMIPGGWGLMTFVIVPVVRVVKKRSL